MPGLVTMDRQSQPQAMFHDQGSTALAQGLPHQVDPRVVLSSIGEAVYDWDIASDTLSWSGNAVSLFGVQHIDRLNKGGDFNKLLDPISPATRSEAILLCETRDAGGGVPYRLSFAIQQSKGALLWFEDTGRWFAGADGRAAAAHGVVRRIDGPTEHERREIASSKIDELTGGYLRAPFVRLLADDLAKAKTKDKTAVVMLVAIDDLSFVNTSLGFEAADEVIAGVARRLRGAIRGKDRFARFSGTKLGVLLTTFDGEDVREAAHRLMAAVSAEPIHISSGPVAVKLQIGSASAPQDGSDPVALLKRAEEALTEARSAANPDFVAYRADVSRDEARRRNLSASDDVLRALNDRRVIIALEPVLSADGRVLQFHEALVRVKAEDGAILGAGAIIPVAERFGLVKFVDIRVLELAVDMLRADARCRLSVNVSMRTAVTPEWMTAISSLVAANPGVANRLIIEITETAAMSDLDATAEIVRRIKDLGLRVAIDDFGSGHTSFRSLRALPVDILKIDGVFIQNLARSADDRFFVRTLVDLAGHLGVQTVAEWVQDEETAKLLAEWGVTFLQGEFCGLARIEGEMEAAHEPLLAVG
jgi:diguanylate cyclase (GGDEF)-like protein